MGIGAKMFTIVGPVIVYGFGAGVVYGLIELQLYADTKGLTNLVKPFVRRFVIAFGQV